MINGVSITEFQKVKLTSELKLICTMQQSLLNVEELNREFDERVVKYFFNEGLVSENTFHKVIVHFTCEEKDKKRIAQEVFVKDAMSLIVDNMLSTTDESFSYTLERGNTGATFDYVAMYRGFNIAFNLTFMSIQEFEELFPEKQNIVDIILARLNADVKFAIDKVFTK